MSDPIEPYEQRTGVFGLACSLSVLQLWHWAPEWLHDFLDDWRYRLGLVEIQDSTVRRGLIQAP